MSDNLEERVEKLETKINEHHEILGGGTTKEEPGLMHLMRQIWKDVYDEKHGIKPRMDKWEWLAKGAYAMLVVIVGLLAWLWVNRGTIPPITKP